MPRSKVVVKVMGQGQMSMSNFSGAAVDIRGSALSSAAKSKEGSFSVYGIFPCVE